ncbi:prepilin-type N-terminal cleavage/methylation domain-containing protein [Mesobacillus subterraneus]|uniref:prepilin-type N-terminal cleavage/methylation domain-containing protein n=1 Tax=Mesobacillus subterraneus TaxID=285983 RepID=UPI00203DF82D|nr:prepilin-type N-terminal cleavage/methylation domain-containing protein [Mesobacillus subterraneus]MCM3663824.1 prepilin-type N-terminal cleavage/methylation domain-containing protein [Mesobacillus subterraneus]MCM3683585.1 prepilin-type N-terminal cleavage/methylation domain-containing protein [Mesobacillus subterraneus]
MKRNGFTLVELLAALALTGIIIVLVFSVLQTGIKQGESSKKDAFLQQEAQLIANTIRNKHLKESAYQLEIKADEVLIDGKAISKSYIYKAEIVYENHIYVGERLQIDTKLPLELTLMIKKGEHAFTLRTLFARGISDEEK